MTSEPTGTAIRVIGCSKTFGDGTRALEPVDLTVEPGETLVLLGPSGCGKTTTLRIIAGLEHPDTGGRVFFDDDDVTPRPIETRRVGMVFQNYALFPNMNVAENIGYGLRVQRKPVRERQQRVAEMVAMMQLQGLEQRRIDELSGGQRQRVALARALAVRPRVLLLDEPLTALDAALRESLRNDIDRLLRSLRVTTVYVTHDQAEAMALGDRIVVMDHGCIAQIGTPRQIYQQPANAFVAGFVGKINRLAGVLHGSVVETPAGSLPSPVHGSGEEIELLFRPEDALLGEPGPDALSAQIESITFLGDRTRLTVSGPGGLALIIDTSQRRAYRTGQAVGVTIPRECLIRLDSPAATRAPEMSA